MLIEPAVKICKSVLNRSVPDRYISCGDTVDNTVGDTASDTCEGVGCGTVEYSDCKRYYIWIDPWENAPIILA